MGKTPKMGSGFDLLNTKVQQQKQRFEDAKKRFVPTVWMKDGESKVMRFIDMKPILVYEHTIRDDRGKFQTYTCRTPVTADESTSVGVCPLCDNDFKRSLRGVFNVIDRAGYVDRKGKKKGVGEVVLLKANTDLASQLKGLAERGKLATHDIEITRTGEGKDTRYQALPVDEATRMSVADKQKKRMVISEKLKPMSIEEMKKLLGLTDPGQEEETEEGDEEEKPRKKGRPSDE